MTNIKGIKWEASLKFVTCFFIAFLLTPVSVIRADVASVDWLHKYVLDKTGIILPPRQDRNDIQHKISI